MILFQENEENISRISFRGNKKITVDVGEFCVGRFFWKIVAFPERENDRFARQPSESRNSSSGSRRIQRSPVWEETLRD